jgi:2-dehydropantoate 2-reductase
MKICVYGAGAVGGVMAARLAASGHEVSLIARGPNLQALQTNGIGLELPSGREYYQVKASSEPSDLGVQDLVIISVKQPSFNVIVGKIAPLLGAQTKVLVAMNGVPWWFLDGLEKAPIDKVLKTLDPEGNLRQILPSNQVIGCVVHFACSVPEAGVSRLNGGNRLILGESDGKVSDLLVDINGALNSAGFDSEISTHIQKDIWFKLWGNMTMNPISALTRTTTDKILDDKLVNEFCCRIMTEAAEIGNLLGLPIDQTPQERNGVTRQLGAMKTSMLQDAEKGNALEYEALIGVVHEIAQKLEFDVPNISTLYGLIRLYGMNN